MVLFKDGMRIDLTTDIGTNDYLYYGLSAFFMIIFWLGLFLGIFLRNPALHGMMASMIIYWIYSSCTNSCKYLNNLVELVQTFKNIALAT